MLRRKGNMAMKFKLPALLITTSAIFSMVFGAVAIRSQQAAHPQALDFGCSSDLSDDACYRTCYYSSGVTEYVTYPSTDYGKCGSPCKDITCTGTTYNDPQCTEKNGTCTKKTQGCLDYQVSGPS